MGNHKVIKVKNSCTTRYSMYEFIGHIKAHPILWQREHANFHNRERREEAWLGIAEKVHKNFSTLTQGEKQELAKMLAKRWKNTRDSFYRIEKSKRAGDQSRSYIYEAELEFLLCKRNFPDDDDELDGVKASVVRKIPMKNEAITPPSVNRNKRKPKPSLTPEKSTLSTEKITVASKKFRLSTESQQSLTNSELPVKNVQDLEAEINADDMEIINFEQALESLNANSEGNKNMSNNKNLKTCSKALRNQDDLTENSSVTIVYASPLTQNEDAVPQQQHQQHTEAAPHNDAVSKEVDADQAFFDSIKPIVRNMSVDKKLDFQIEVLRLLKNFRSN